MRKITLFLGLCCTLLAAIHVKAQNYICSETPISSAAELTTGRYLISVYSKSKEGLLYWSTSGYNLYINSTTASSKTGQTLDPTGADANYMWDIVKDADGSFTIQSVKSGKFTSKMGQGGEGKHNTLTVEASSENIGRYAISSSVNISNIPHFTIRMTNGTFCDNGHTTYFHCNSGTPVTLGTSGEALHLSYWEGEDTSTGSNTCVKMAFYRIERTISLDYRYYINGVSVMTETKQAAINSEFPEPTLPAFCTASKPTGTVTAEDEGTIKTINVTWNGPFEFSSTINEAKWYLMTLGKGDNKKLPVVRYVDGQNYMTLEETDNTFSYAKNDQWAFVGNPFDGFKIYNRANNGRLIATTEITTDGAKTTFPYVSTEALPSNFTELWDIYKAVVGGGQTAIDGGFAIGEHGIVANKINRRWQKVTSNYITSDYRLAFWTTGSDNGSTFTVSQADLPDITLNLFEGDGKTYASFYIDYPVVVNSDNVKVYTGTVDGNTLNMTKADDKIIPAGVGVVLIGDDGGATTAALSIANSEGALANANGSIEGTTVDWDITGLQDTYLVLGLSNDEPHSVGFFRPADTITEIPAYRAYIRHLASNPVRGFNFNFDGTTTAIDNATLSTEKAQGIYDLSGRRVSKAGKGIYIMGGKKIYVK